MLLMKRKHEQIVPQNLNTSGCSNSTARPDMSLVPPIRQTASIFKQSVTVVKSLKGSVKGDLVFGNQEKPKQLFWEKRLQGLTPCDKREQVIESFELPKKIKAVGIELSDDTLIRSIATALHLNGHPITGQNRPKALLEKNPGVHINPNQPLVLGLHVTDEDVAEQEKRVEEAREQLKAVMNEHHN